MNNISPFIGKSFAFEEGDSLATDDVMLREPRLLVPRTMPVGPIAPVAEHPLVRDASWAYVLRPNLPIGKLFFGRPRLSAEAALQLAPNYRAVPLISNGNPGYGGSALTSGSITRNSSTPMVATSDGAYTGAFSLLCVASSVSAAISQVAVHNRDNSSPYLSVVFRFNAYLSNGGTTTNTSAGDVHFSVYNTDGGHNSRGVQLAGYLDGRLHAFLGVRTAANVFHLYADGQLMGSYDAAADGFTTPAPCCSSASGFALGGFASTGNTTGMREAVHFAAEWDRVLTDAEACSITADPFQLIRPA